MKALDRKTESTMVIMQPNSESMKNVSSLAKLMASSKVTVPKHLQGSEGDCLAIILQASNWGMNPFAVAQKTHLVNGVLGYEAQLVNAVVQTSGAIQGGFNYEYQGEGNNLSCRVGAVIKGQSEITWGEFLRSGEVTTKNSPLWKTNPKQQLGYLQVKNWARLYCPAAILGVYTADELEAVPAEEKDITQQASEVKPDKAIVSDDVFNENIGKWRDLVKVKGKSPEWVITFIESKGILTDKQKEVIRSWDVVVVENEVLQGKHDDFINGMAEVESAGQ